MVHCRGAFGAHRHHLSILVVARALVPGSEAELNPGRGLFFESNSFIFCQ